jgi:VIT1/CCC1 family predicted Fe2+/Mn2+ transporter
MDAKTLKTISGFQRNEITEFRIYNKLAGLCRDKKNSEVLSGIAEQEQKHYKKWKEFTGKDIKPDGINYFKYVLIARIFGVTFAVKLMENGEKKAQSAYSKIASAIPEAEKIIDDENEHEKKLIGMIDEEKLRYIGSIVLGLNDALVELTGTLAGLTFALANTRVIAVAGLITGIAASLSMAASEYLSTRSEGKDKDAVKSAFYTLITYFGAVVVLILPYLILSSYLLALLFTLCGAAAMIFIFTFYFSVVRDISFRQRFLEMLGISFGVAGLSFMIGLAVRFFLGINI